MGWFDRKKPSQSATTPQGWYPDTGGSGQLRYWDGQAWTDHFASTTGVSEQAPHRGADASIGVLKSRPTTRLGRGVAPWSEKLVYQEVVGESFHQDSFKAIAAEYGQKSLPEHGFEVPEAMAAIVPDPENRYDSNAVAVWVEGRHLVGHLPREISALWSSKLETLDRGAHLQVPARVWIGSGIEWNERTGEDRNVIRGSVTVRLPDPDGIVPFKDLPDEPHTVLPWGRAVQITGEEHHMEVLRTFALGANPRHVAATLHIIEEPRRTGDPVRVVEVRLDGEPVGVMSKAISDQIRDLVNYVAERGRTPVARAIVKGSDLRADVVVHVARTSDVPHKWLETVVDEQS